MKLVGVVPTTCRCISCFPIISAIAFMQLSQILRLRNPISLAPMLTRLASCSFSGASIAPSAHYLSSPLGEAPFSAFAFISLWVDFLGSLQISASDLLCLLRFTRGFPRPLPGMNNNHFLWIAISVCYSVIG